MIKDENVNLQCEVNGNPVPDVRWIKDGDAVNLTDQRINVSFVGNTSILTIASVVQGDEGPYRCVANNSLNTVTSYPGTLVVHCEFIIVLFSLDTTDQLITQSTCTCITMLTRNII